MPGAVELQALACHDGAVQHVDDVAAEEVPIALQYNGISHAVMLATPLDLHDFAVGFSLSEGLIDSAADLHDFDQQATPAGIVLQLDIASRCLARLKERRRTLAGRTGCGLCGAESLEQLSAGAVTVDSSLAIVPGALSRAMSRLRASQPLLAATGATHAAAWCSADGTVVLAREDVGRHNALDKLIGALARAGTDTSQGFVAVTSRASFEMVHKCAKAGVALMAAISAPTSLAVRTAAQAGVCLVGFARGDDWVAYAHPHRILTSMPSLTTR